MQAGYVNTLYFPAALGLTFAAAKAAEVAPGVGSNIDVAIVLEDHVEDLRSDLAAELLEFYKRYEKKYNELALSSIYELRDFIATLPEKIPDAKTIEGSGIDAETDGSTPASAVEASQRDENGPKAIGQDS